MQSVCDEYFNALFPTNSSIDNEIFIAKDCVNNSAKLTLFIFWLLIWIIMLIWSGSKTAKDLIDNRWSWNNRRGIYLITSIMSVCQILLYIIYLAGFHNKVKYFVLALIPFMARLNISVLLRAWFQTISDRYTEESIRIIKLVFKIADNAMNILSGVSCFVCFLVGPMVAYPDKPELINWFYIFGISLSSVSGFTSCILMIVVGMKLKALCHVDNIIKSQNNDLEILGKKISFVIFVAFGCIGLQFGIIIIPIWMIWDLYGVFYFHFTLNEFGIFLSGFLTMFLFTKFGKILGVSTNTSENSSKPEIVMPPKFSFTVEEMTTRVSPDEMFANI